jgi:anti-anti-sigma factor
MRTVPPPKPGNDPSRCTDTAATPAAPLPIDARRPPMRTVPSTPLITAVRFSDGLALRITGELDIASASTLEQELERAAALSSLILLDLRNTTFMDATALGVITRSDQRIREFGGRLILVPGSLAVRRLLGVSGMYGRLEIVDDYAP